MCGVVVLVVCFGGNERYCRLAAVCNTLRGAGMTNTWAAARALWRLLPASPYGAAELPALVLLALTAHAPNTHIYSLTHPPTHAVSPLFPLQRTRASISWT